MIYSSKEFNELINVLKKPIPNQEYIIGFLDIIGKQRNENFISRLYAYFINHENAHLSSLFVDSLLSLIKEKNSIINIDLFESKAFTEEKRGSGRVDIVIYNHDKTNAVIIENKIDHYLNNDLLNYWNKTKIKNKVGVLLTIDKHEIPKNVKGKFINISHSEWIEEIESRGLPKGISTQSLIHLNDFINTLKNMSQKQQFNKQVKFYFENAKQILLANETLQSAHKFLNNELNTIAQKLGWVCEGSSPEWRNIYDEKGDLEIFLTVVVEGLLKGDLKYSIYLEISGEARKNHKDIVNFIKDDPQYKSMKKKYREVEKNYMHLAYHTYDDIKIEDIKDFSTKVVENIKNDFARVTLLAIKKYYKTIFNTLEWRNNDFWREIKY